MEIWIRSERNLQSDNIQNYQLGFHKNTFIFQDVTCLMARTPPRTSAEEL